MKILHVTSSFYPARAYGGGAEVAYQLSKRLAARGHEVTVFTTDADDRHSRLNGIPAAEGVEVRCFRNLSNTLAYEHKLFLSPGIVSALKREISGFDVVHCHDARTFQNMATYWYARRHGVPYVVQAHGAFRLVAEKRALKRVLDILFGYRFVRGAATMLAQSDAEAEEFRSMGIPGERVQTIPHGIDLSQFQDLPPRGVFRRKYGIGERERIVLYLGRLHPVKGLDLLLRAFAGLPDGGERTRLVVVGPDDGYLAPARKLAASLDILPRVLFTGPLYDRDKLEAYVDADVYVLPSHYEIFGITLLEAAACGLPAVTTTASPLAGRIDGVAGKAVPCDSIALGETIRTLLADEGLRQRLRSAGPDLARSSDWDRVVDTLEECYRNMTQNRRATGR